MSLSTGTSRRSVYAFYAIMALVIILRLAVVAHMSSIPMFHDQAEYNKEAVKFVQGEKWVPEWPPGLPLFVSGIYAVTGPSDLAANMGIFALGLLALYLVFVLSRRLGLDDNASMAAVLLVALMPGSFYYSSILVVHVPTAVPLLLMAVFLVKYHDSGSAGDLAAASAMCGIMSLVRAGGVFVFPVMLAVMFFRRDIKRPLKYLAAVLPFGIIVGSWTYYLWDIGGEFVFINTFNSFNLFLGNNEFTHLYRTWDQVSKPELYAKAMALIPGLDAMTPGQKEDAFFDAAINFIISRPDLFIVRAITRALTFWSFDTKAASTILKLGLLPHVWAMAFMAADALANLVVIFCIFLSPVAARYDKRALIPALLGAGYMAQFLLAFSHPSYHYPVLLVMAPLAGKTLVDLGRAGPARAWRMVRRNRAGVWLVAAFCVIQALWVVFMADRFGYLK